MKKLKYTKPEIVTVSFHVEIGSITSGLGMGSNNSSLYHDHERFRYDNDFGTGETYGSYTDERGEYSTGTW